MDPDLLSEGQLHRHIADLRAQRRILDRQIEEALEEWTHRHGTDPGTCTSAEGVTVRLVPHRRWDPELAQQVIQEHPDLADQLSTLVVDRAKAKEILDEATYARCQRLLPKPKILIELEHQSYGP